MTRAQTLINAMDTKAPELLKLLDDYGNGNLSSSELYPEVASIAWSVEESGTASGEKLLFRLFSVLCGFLFCLLGSPVEVVSVKQSDQADSAVMLT